MTPSRTLVSLTVLLVGTAQAIKFVDQISRSAVDVLHGSERPGTVRQCTCQELSDCYDSSRVQAIDCFQPCWAEVSAVTSVTNNPDALKKCFDARQAFLTELVNCFKHKIKACAENQASAEKTLVHNYDYHDMIRRVEDVVNEQIRKFLQSVTSLSVKQVMDAGAKLARCVKTCFIEKNRGGFCFDRIPCQPNISDRNAKLAVRQCARQISWKTEVGELCKCSSKAGVSGISDYCGMLNIMGK